MSQTRAAPHQLDLVIDFVNTLDIEAGTDELGAWLAARGLPAESVGEEGLERARALREALRQAMLANNGGAVVKSAEELLEEEARRGELSMRFREGTALLEPCAGGLDGALASLLAPVAAAMSDGTWTRVKACRADDCQWAFYDRSRNRSGTWCDMAVCGNRQKVRAYRERSLGDHAPRAR